jgi:hypothetical protein
MVQTARTAAKLLLHPLIRARTRAVMLLLRICARREPLATDPAVTVRRIAGDNPEKFRE